MSTEKRTYPIFPIPSVGAVILHQEHILLIQRGQAPAAGKWTLPGGVVEVGESPEEAIVREVREECQLDIHVLGILDVVNRIVRDDQNVVKYHYIIIDYLACWRETGSLSDVSLQPGTDIRDVRWVSLPDVIHYDLTDGLHQIIRAGIAMQSQWSQY